LQLKAMTWKELQWLFEIFSLYFKLMFLVIIKILTQIHFILTSYRF